MCEEGIDYGVCTRDDNDVKYVCWKTPPGNFEIINYRYMLKKEWKERMGKEEWKDPLIIIGCNPSKANEDRLDQTMIRVERFIENKKYCGYIMLNLYPQIASDVEALPADITPLINHIKHIQSVNLCVIKKVLKNNKESDILFSFGELIRKRFFLYNLCFNSILNIIDNNDKIKKLDKINIKTNEIKQFAYPPHFLNPAFDENEIDNAVIEDFNIEAYRAYIGERLGRHQFEEKGGSPTFVEACREFCSRA